MNTWDWVLLTYIQHWNHNCTFFPVVPTLPTPCRKSIGHCKQMKTIPPRKNYPPSRPSFGLINQSINQSNKTKPIKINQTNQRGKKASLRKSMRAWQRIQKTRGASSGLPPSQLSLCNACMSTDSMVLVLKVGVYFQVCIERRRPICWARLQTCIRAMQWCCDGREQSTRAVDWAALSCLPDRHGRKAMRRKRLLTREWFRCTGKEQTCMRWACFPRFPRFHGILV